MDNEVLQEVTEVVEVVTETIDTTQLELLITQNNELLKDLINLITVQNDGIAHIYAGMTYFIAIAVPFVICLLLYNFLKKFL